MENEESKIINEARNLIDDLETFIGNEEAFDNKLDKILNDWKETQERGRKTQTIDA